MTELISIDNLTFSYGPNGSAEAVLRNFSMTIEEGECFCLLGPSGCGKSTALKLIAGFEFPTEGRIALEGRPIRGPGVDRGVVFQGDDSLFDWLKAIDNVAFGLKMAGVKKRERLASARRILELVGLRGQEEKYPAELSGGMKQRIQIARVLANNPKILLMDEPFAAVDAQTRAELQDELVRVWSETRKTLLFITHDIAEAILLGDRIGVMATGPAAKIQHTLVVDMPRPRTRSSLEFGRLYEQISDMIKTEVNLSRASRR
jgi:NitT/TauT family transport system ATP-binding protein